MIQISVHYCQKDLDSQVPLICLYPLEERWILQFPFHPRLSQATCARCVIWVFYDCHKRHLSPGKSRIIAQFNSYSIYACQKQHGIVFILCIRRGIAEFHTLPLVYDCHKRPVSVGKDRISLIPFHVQLSHTERVRGKISNYVHFVSVTIVVLLGGLCPSGNHWVSHTLTLSLLI